jgi:hypothetical protein
MKRVDHGDAEDLDISRSDQSPSAFASMLVNEDVCLSTDLLLSVAKLLASKV